jgi:hypothetical protein
MSEIIPPWEGAKTFEVKMCKHPNGTIEKAIFIDGEMLDWSIDMNSYLEAVKMGFAYQREAQKSIEKHFQESVSDFLERRVTIEEIKQATKTGWI